MHLPDGFLSTSVWTTTDAVSAGALGYALHRVNKKLDPLKVPWMAVMAAFVFALQMINIPIPGLIKVSGHPLGGLLTAVLVGPFEATIVMTAVFVVQALLFQDGGILVLGANVLNMGLAATLGMWFVYAALRRISGNRAVQTGILFVSAWLSVVVGAFLAATELWLSRTVPLPAGALFAAMLGVHALIGVAEGVVTVVAVHLIVRVCPDLLDSPREKTEGGEAT